MFFYYFLVVFSFDIAKIHIKLKNDKENMKNYKVFLKLLPFQGVRVATVITQGDCPGLGASALSGRVGASHQLRFLLAERLHNALLSPISFCHRLKPFLFYFHNSLEIKSFFPLNLFQKCFPANYTCCVCRKTFCKQLQFGIVYKPSITEKYNIFLKSGNILRNIFKKAVEYYRNYPCFYTQGR